MLIQRKFLFFQVDFVHNIFCKALTTVFDTQKDGYGWGRKVLKIV